MQKTFIVAISILLFSCHSEEKKEPAAKTAATDAGPALPYTATYSAKFEMGDNKHSEAILNAWKSFDDGNLQTARKLFADTIYLYLRDGSEMHGATDSVMPAVQAYRNMYSSVKSTVHAYMPLKSTDKNENWVCVWGTEVSTDKQGKVDSVGLEESWRFDKNGKIDLMYQYGRSLVPPAAPK
ncbi:MAG TPA: hypothetical protein VKB95_11205 [Chitinophagaceae bacterium]|nr:hypothetical protein [Chitinophagaceae bacterium]